MEMNGPYPQRHPSHTQEDVSEEYFKSCLPREWYVEKPKKDYAIDLFVHLVINGNVVGLKFALQLKSKQDAKGKLESRLEKSTLNYLFTGLDQATKR